MSGRFTAVKQPGSSKKHRTGADRTDASDSLGHLSDPLHHLNVDLILLNRTSASYEQSVDLPTHTPKRVMSRDSQSAVCHDRGARRSGYDFDGIDRG